MIRINHQNIIIALLSACVIAMIVAGYYAVKDVKNPKFGDELEKISADIRARYAAKPSYWGLEEELVSFNGNEIGIGYGFDSIALMPGAKTFDVVYRDLNYKDCRSVLTQRMEKGLKLSVFMVALKSDEGETEFSWGGENSLPVFPSVANKLCKKNNDVLWRFE